MKPINNFYVGFCVRELVFEDEKYLQFEIINDIPIHITLMIKNVNVFFFLISQTFGLNDER